MSEKKGLFAGLFGGGKSGGCCSMEIVEEESGCCCEGDCCGETAAGPFHLWYPQPFPAIPEKSG